MKGRTDPGDRGDESRSDELVEVRRATTSDADAISEIHVASFRATYAGLLPTATLDGLRPAARAAVWEQRIRTEDGEVVVASVGGRPVGYCWFAAVTPHGGQPLGELRSIHVNPDEAGRGYGRALLRTTAGALRARGCAHATLWVVATNTHAQQVYARDGWRPDGAVRREPLGLPGEDAPEVDVIRLRRELGRGDQGGG